MKHLVDGREVELHDGPEVATHRVGERLFVRSHEGAASAAVARSGEATLVSIRGKVYRIEKAGAKRATLRSPASGEVHAPMPGQIAAVLVEEGQEVESGQKLLVLEAMKTQQPVLAAFDGIVRALPVAPGEQVREGDLLVRVEPTLES